MNWIDSLIVTGPTNSKFLLQSATQIRVGSQSRSRLVSKTCWWKLCFLILMNPNMACLVFPNLIIPLSSSWNISLVIKQVVTKQGHHCLRIRVMQTPMPLQLVRWEVTCKFMLNNAWTMNHEWSILGGISLLLINTISS